MSDDPDIRIGPLDLFIQARQFEESQDYWDGNWLLAKARIAVPGAFVEMEGPFLRIDELAHFLYQLESAFKTLRGDARLDTLEPNLQVNVAFIDALGHAEVAIEIRPDCLRQEHRFIESLDQSHLQETIRQLQAVLRDYPMRGEADRKDWRPPPPKKLSSRLMDLIFGPRDNPA